MHPETDLVVISAYFDDVIEIVVDEEEIWKKKMQKRMKDIKTTWHKEMDAIFGMVEKVLKLRNPDLEVNDHSK